MKVRNGFVSNSSSSSFVLITTKENYDRAMKEATPFQQALVKAMAKEGIFMGKPVVKFGAMSVMDCGMFEYLDIDFEEPEPKEDEDDEELLRKENSMCEKCGMWCDVDSKHRMATGHHVNCPVWAEKNVKSRASNFRQN